MSRFATLPIACTLLCGDIKERRFLTVGLAMLLAFFLNALTPGFAGTTRFENFDNDPGWTTVGNALNGNDFGFQSSANAGGSPGEAGGRFTRSAFARFHGDTDLGGNLTLQKPISASGKFDFILHRKPDFGRAFMIGHFSSAGSAKIGINFTDNSTSRGFFWQPRIVFDDGSEILHPAFEISPNIDRLWSYTWDPTGGSSGLGLLTVSLSGPGGGTETIEITPAQTGLTATFDGFGFSGAPAGKSDPLQFADMFIDDVTYSVVSQFIRGDTNADGIANVADAVFVVKFLFNPVHGIEPSCLDAADIDDDGGIDIADAISLVRALFSRRATIPPPFPECGTDETPDELDCESHFPCNG